MNYKEKDQLSASLVTKAEKKLEKRFSSANYLLKHLLQPGNIFEYGSYYVGYIKPTRRIMLLQLFYLEKNISHHESAFGFETKFQFFDLQSKKIQIAYDFFLLRAISKAKAANLKLIAST